MNHIAAIHVLKGLLKLQDDDYRALLQQLVGKTSSKGMTPTEQAFVRTHLDKLATRMGVQTPVPTGLRPDKPAKARSATPERPQVRKLKAMWWALADVGAVDRPGSAGGCYQAVEAWAKRQAGAGSQLAKQLGHMDALRFASSEQLNKLIEELKAWGQRVGAKLA